MAAKKVGGNTGKNTDKKHHRKPGPRSLANLRPPWKPGQSGNPDGRPKDALSRILREIVEAEWRAGLTIGEHIAWAIVKKALRGSLSAATLILDRTEGRPRQALDLSYTPAPVDLASMRVRSAQRLADEFGKDIDTVLADLEDLEG